MLRCLLYATCGMFMDSIGALSAQSLRLPNSLLPVNAATQAGRKGAAHKLTTGLVRHTSTTPEDLHEFYITRP